jgi:hypothetical protein
MRLCQRDSHTICGVPGLTSFLAVCIYSLGPALNGNFGLHERVLLNNNKYRERREVKRMIAT